MERIKELEASWYDLASYFYILRPTCFFIVIKVNRWSNCKIMRVSCWSYFLIMPLQASLVLSLMPNTVSINQIVARARSEFRIILCDLQNVVSLTSLILLYHTCMYQIYNIEICKFTSQMSMIYRTVRD